MTAGGTGNRVVKLSAGDVHRLLLGQGGPLVVLEQAYRLTPDHSDELVLLGSGRDFWVAARLGDRTSVWACHDRESAEDTFELMLTRGHGWKVATPGPAAPAA